VKVTKLEAMMIKLKNEL